MAVEDEEGDADKQNTGGNLAERRQMPRFKHGSIATLFDVARVQAKIVTAQRSYPGNLLDMSTLGLALLSPIHLPENAVVQVSLIVGYREIIFDCRARHSQKIGGKFKIGFEFVELNDTALIFIQSFDEMAFFL